MGTISSSSPEPTKAVIGFPSASQDTDSYELCLNGSCQTAKVAEGALTIEGLEPRTNYSANLTAIDAAGNRSESIAISFETKSLGQLPVPQFSLAEYLYKAQQLPSQPPRVKFVPE